MKLQAVIRGELARRRLVAKLKFMLPFQMPKPRVYHIRVPTVEEYYESIEKKLSDSMKETVKSNELKVRELISYDIYHYFSLWLIVNCFTLMMKSVEHGFAYRQLKCNSQRTWDFSLASKEEIDSLISRRQEAIAKRERMMKYSFSHRVISLAFRIS